MCLMVLQNVVAVPVSSAAAHEAAYHGVPLTTLQDAEQVGSSVQPLRCEVMAAYWQTAIHRMYVDVQYRQQYFGTASR
jgi:hypothetical protein